MLVLRSLLANTLTIPPADYCNCCDYSAMKVQPLFAISASFNVCTGSDEAPQACSCSAEGLKVSEIIIYIPYYMKHSLVDITYTSVPSKIQPGSWAASQVLSGC